MPNLTPNFSFNLPLVNDPIDEDLWGGQLNSNWTSVDGILPVPSASKFGAIVVQSTDDASYEILSGQGTANQVLTSNGADALPNFQDNDADVITTRGDIVTGDSSGDPQRLALGASGTVLTSDGTDAIWGTPSGRIVQVVNTQTGASSTIATNMPIDDTIPQITEGGEVMTRAITPTNSSNLLKIDVVTNQAVAATVESVGIALFQDSTANALAMAVADMENSDPNKVDTRAFTHFMTAGTTSATTLRVRIGSDTGGGTVTFNGQSGSRIGGGVMASSITITEIAA